MVDSSQAPKLNPGDGFNGGPVRSNPHGQDLEEDQDVNDPLSEWGLWDQWRHPDQTLATVIYSVPNLPNKIDFLTDIYSKAIIYEDDPENGPYPIGLSENDDRFEFGIHEIQYADALYDENGEKYWERPGREFNLYYSRSDLFKCVENLKNKEEEKEFHPIGHGYSIALTVKLEDFNEELDLSLQSKEIMKLVNSIYFGRSIEEHKFSVLIVIFPSTSVNVPNRPPLPYTDEKLLAYSAPWKAQSPWPPDTIPEALCWINKTSSIGLVGIILTDGRFSTFELISLFDMMAASGTCSSLIYELSLLSSRDDASDCLSQAFELIHTVQNWLEYELHQGKVYQSSLFRSLVDRILSENQINRIMARIVGKTRILQSQLQNKILLSQARTLELQNSFISAQTEELNQIQLMATAQTKILEEIKLFHEAQENQTRLQEATNRWAGRFGMVAAVIAVALSTAALFAGLAAIPFRQAGSFEVEAPLNLALTIVAVSTAVAFTLIVIREGFDVLKKLPMVWVSGGSILAACLLGLFGRWIPFFHGWVSASVLGALLLIATVAATLFLSEIERSLGGANRDEARKPLRRRPRANS